MPHLLVVDCYKSKLLGDLHFVI